MERIQGRRIFFRWRAAGACLCLAVLLLFRASPARPATYHVDRFDDDGGARACTSAAADCSLRGAVLAAGENAGPDTIRLPAGRYAVSGGREGGAHGPEGAPIAFRGELDLVGAGADRTAISGGGAGRIFEVLKNARVRMKGVTLTGGRVRAGADKPGGAVFVADGATLHLHRCVLTRNSAEAGNRGGGAIGDAGGRLLLEDCKLSHNWTSGESGAGGALFVSGRAELTGCLLESNRTTGRFAPGGAIYNDAGEVIVRDSGFTGNSTMADDSPGGAVCNSAGEVQLEGGRFSGNATLGEKSFGGAVHNGGRMSVRDTAVAHNRTVGRTAPGGGVANLFGELEGAAVTLEANRTEGDGSPGGAFYSTGRLTLENSTVSGNFTGGERGDGGGLYLDRGDASLLHCTLAYNRVEGSGSRGGGLFNLETRLRMGNSILAANGAAGEGRDVRGSLHSLGGNVIGDSSRAAVTREPDVSDRAGRASAPIDPKLEPLGPNPPGSTRTHALRPDSPAVDNGVPGLCAAVDQRGAERFSSGRDGGRRCDSGAYELTRWTGEFIVQIAIAAAVLLGVSIALAVYSRSRRHGQTA